MLLRLFPKDMMAYYLAKLPHIKLHCERSNTDSVLKEEYENQK